MIIRSNSILPIFKIGIGASSSHTLGAMFIGKAFCEETTTKNLLDQITRIRVDLYGSLSLTGKGHLSDIAIILGLSGYIPNTITSSQIEQTIKNVSDSNELIINQVKKISFTRNQDIIFNSNFLDYHENGIKLTAYDNNNIVLEKIYFSIGGGFIKSLEDFTQKQESHNDVLDIDFRSANDLLKQCKKLNKPISEIALLRELQFYSKDEIYNYYKEIWEVMQCSINNGLSADGILPRGLNLPRKAKKLYNQLQNSNSERKQNDFLSVEWIVAYALAVAEENVAGHRIVTAPTNGACAIVPAVMAYCNKFYKPLDDESTVKFLLTASAIGYLYKINASISGAEAGCQAEIGSASSMAAVAIAELLGATPEIACVAGEIAMVHHLGLTCDPVEGLVQVPCIERNSFGAVKAVMAAKMAISHNQPSIINLDETIATMFRTGKGINPKYREPSLGGLAETFKKSC